MAGVVIFLLFIDIYSRMSWVYFLENKSETFEKFQHFKAMVEKQSGLHIKALRTERDGEFLSNQFTIFCQENGIHRELTVPYTTKQNGIGKRKNRTIVEIARSMLQVKGLSNQFWTETVATSVYLLNLSPTRAAMNQTPFEAWKGKKSFVSHLRIFRCISYALVNSQVRKKLDEKSEKCIFVGYHTQSKAYRLFNPLSGKIIISRNVIFDENARWNWQENEEKVQQQISIDNEKDNQVPTPTNSVASSPVISPNSSPASSSSLKSLRHNSSSTLEESSDETPPRKFRSLTEIYESCQFALLASDPVTYAEAAGTDEWQKAMLEELMAIEKNATWKMVGLPEGKNAISLKWVFKTKYCAEGNVQKYKARLVAKGYAQQHGIDFKETFSPIACFETVRIVLSLAAQLCWPIYQFDVKSAFLNGTYKKRFMSHSLRIL